MKMSKKLWALISLSLLFVTACGSASAPVPVETPKEVGPFVSEKGNFSINFPGKPEITVDPAGVDGDLGLGGETYTYDPSPTQSFNVSYTDADPETINSISKENLRALLKEGQAGFLEEFGLKVPEEEKEVDYDGKYPGLRYKASAADEYAVAQNYLIESRFYQILIMKIGSYPTDEEVNNFIGSFKLLK